MASDAEDFDAFVLSVREVFFALRRISDDLLADLGCTAVERSVLDELHREGPRRVPDLAFGRAVSRQTMQKTVDRLLDRKWLVAQANPRHLKSSLLALTETGGQVLAEIRGRERRLLAKTTLPVAAAELRRTTASLRELAKSFAKTPARGTRRAAQGD